MKTGIFFLLLITLTSVVIAAEKVILEADSVTSVDNSTAIAEGNVIIHYKDTTLTADKIIFNQKTSDIDASGNVTLLDNATRFSSSRIRLNIDNQTGIIDNSTGFYPPYTHIKAEKIHKISDAVFYLNNAQITSCGDETPDWSIKTKSAKVEKNRYIKSKHTTFRLKDVPIIYTPYLVWPIKKKRETGFLIPQFGTSSSKGQFISPKFFWNIDVDKDATFGINYFTNVGPHYLGEFRYNISKKENIYLASEFIHHTSSESDKIDRWKLVNQSNIFFTDNLELKMNTNYVSDFRYDREFGDYSIYTGEDVDEDNTKNKYINEFRLNYYNPYANVSIRYRDDMEYTDLDDGYLQTRIIRSPNILIEKNNIRFKYIRLSYKADYNNLSSIKNYFYFDDKNITTNFSHERLHTRIKFFEPFNLKIGTFTPAYTQYLTRWFNMNDEFQTENDHKSQVLSIHQNSNSVDRLIYKSELNFSLNEIYKNYGHFRHSIYNTYTYTFIPEIDQGNIPNLIEEDIITEKELHAFRMKHYLKAENWSATLEFLQEYNERLNDEKFLPFHSKIETRIGKLLYAQLDIKQNNYDHYTPYLKHNLRISHNKFYVAAEYIYDEEITADDNNNLSLSIGVKGFYNFDLRLSETASRTAKNLSIAYLNEYENRTLEAEIKYQSGCWSLGTKYKNRNYINITNDGTSREKEHIYFLYVELKGLGSSTREVHSY